MFQILVFKPNILLLLYYYKQLAPHKLTELALNIPKTKYMVFHSSNRKITYPNLKINNINIDSV